MLPLAAIRRHVVAAQGFASRRRRASVEDAAAAIARLSCVQLDSISTVDRSHRLVLAARVGALPDALESKLLATRAAFEYWAHEASLVPMADWPLFRPRMEERRVHHWFGDVLGADPALARKIMERIRREGPLPSRAFEGKGKGGMWGWKPAKRMLDALWTAGDLVVADRVGFERVYGLPETLVPQRVLDAPAPTAREATEALVLKSVAARGALTLKGICDHYRLGAARDVGPVVDALVAAGKLARHDVDDGGAPVHALPDADVEATPRPRANVLLSPFDDLLWDRAFVERAWGFDHTMEIYKPAPQRVYGYYVMPWLLGDRLVGRADLKADRERGRLVVRRFHLEPGVERSEALSEAALVALSRLAWGLGIEAPESVRFISHQRAGEAWRST